MPGREHIGVILVGAGRRGAEHVRLWRRAGGRVAAVVDSDEAVRQELSRALAAPSYDTLAEALRRCPAAEVVDVCTPPGTHRGLICEALAADRHVLCEKPFVQTLDEAREVASLAAERSRLVVVMHNWAGTPAMREALRMVRRGELGDIVAVHASFVFDHVRDPIGVGDASSWVHSLPGGRLEESLPHAIYTVIALLGATDIEVSHVVAEKRTAYPWVELDTVLAVLGCADRVATIFLSLASEVTRAKVEVVGTKQTADVNFLAELAEKTGARYDFAADRQLTARAAVLLRGAAARAVTLGRRTVGLASGRELGGDLWLVRQFVAALRGSGPPPVSLDEAVATVRLTREIVEAMNRGASGSEGDAGFSPLTIDV